MDYLNLNEQEFNEYVLNIENKTLENKISGQLLTENSIKEYLGYFNYEIETRGHASLLHRKYCFKDTIILSGEEPQNCIFMFFTFNGGVSINRKTKKQTIYKPNTNGLYFLNEESYNETDIFIKEKEIDDIGINIPIDYFENLVNLYPELFEKPFERYKKGESFFLNNNFSETTIKQYQLLSQIQNSNLLGTSNSIFSDSKVLELLSLNFQSYEKSNQITLKNYDKIKEAGFILTSNIDSPPSVKELSLLVGLNPNILRKGFKEVYKNTVYGYLFDYKMELADKLLKENSKTINEIALECGYEYPSHFTTAFKRKFGYTPNSTRKNR